MNFVTVNIYNQENRVDSLLSTAIQLAIIQRVNHAVNNKFNTNIKSAWVCSSGELKISSQAATLLYSTQSPLLESIFHWNDKQNTNVVALDECTAKLARSIETLFSDGSSDRTTTQALIAAEITTDCDSSVVKVRNPLYNNVQVLFDALTGRSTYIGASKLGRQVYKQIVQAVGDSNGHPVIHIIKAPQGAGKTRFLTKLINDTAATGAIRTVCISPRQQLVSSMIISLTQSSSVDPNNILVGASKSIPHATKSHGQRPGDEYPVTVTTINSMGRIWKFTEELARQSKKLEYQLSHNLISDDDYDRSKAKLLAGVESGNVFDLMEPHDVLIYDEFQLLRNTIVDGTHMDNDQAFWIRKHMQRLENDAKVIVVLDADIDNSVLEYFASNHPDSKVHVHRFLLPEQREIHIHTDAASIEYWLMDEIRRLPNQSREQTTPASFAIPCSSATKGRLLEQSIRDLRPDLKVIWIESKNANQAEQRALLEDPALATTYDIIIFSPKIFTGFSFESLEVDGKRIPVANRVVGIFGNRKVNWMERAQSLFRVRDCQEIHFSMSSIKEGGSVPINQTRLERIRLFEFGNMPTPTPVYEYENDNMVLYFRSRGFHIVDHQRIEQASDLLADIKSGTTKTTTIKKKRPPVFNKQAQPFVDRLLQALEFDPTRLTPGEHTMFSGRLCEEFSVHIDRILDDQPALINDIRRVIPNWKRNKKYDIKLVQKMFAATGDSISIRSSQHSTRSSVKGHRIAIYTLTLIVN